MMNNREIKFRAWSKEENKMYYFDLRDYMNVIESDQEEMCPGTALDYLMQFAGLKDRKGNEIYVGDVIQFTDEINNTFHYEVYYSGSSFCVKKLNDTPVEPVSNEHFCGFGEWRETQVQMELDGSPLDTILGYSIIMTNGFEVIGNIYEGVKDGDSK